MTVAAEFPAQISRSDAPPDRSSAALGSMAVEHWPRFVLSTALRAVASALPALQPYFLAEFATSIDDPDRAGRFLVLLFGAGVAHWLLWSACDFYVANWLNRLSYEFKRILFDAVWGEEYRHFVDRPSGKVASYVNDLRTHVHQLWDASHYGFLPMVSAIPVWAFLIWRTSAANAVAYGLFLVVACLALTAVARPLNRRQRALTNSTATNTGRVFDSYSNFVNVFSFQAQRKEIARNNTEIDGLIVDDIRAGNALVTYWAVASMLVRVLLWAAVVGYSWYLFSQGAISFAAMVVSITVLIDFTGQYWNVVYFFGVWVERSASYREAYNYLFPGRDVIAEHYRRAPSAVGTPVEDRRPRLNDRLEIRNLCFAYPDEPDRLVLDNVSFTVQRGAKLGVVGRSGEGKSTLVKILLGFYEPTSGEILVDGRPAGPETLRRLQTYVPQDTSLFQETIGYNIGYSAGGSQPSTVEVETAAVKARIDDFVDLLPNRYETLVGERGIKLSLGQRQRIAIARAFLKQSDVIILDEATSALDSETEARIQESLADLWQDKAAIIIAHRLATLNDVDSIIVVDNGRIVEHGTKDELLSNPGLFAELWGLQQAGVA